jgi:hypothetical protein
MVLRIICNLGKNKKSWKKKTNEVYYRLWSIPSLPHTTKLNSSMLYSLAYGVIIFWLFKQKILSNKNMDIIVHKKQHRTIKLQR